MGRTDETRQGVTAEEAARALAELRAGAGSLTARQRQVVADVEAEQNALMSTVGQLDRVAALDRLPGPKVELPGGELTAGLPAAVQLGKGANGELVVTGLLIGWAADGEPRQEVTSRALRRVKLPDIVALVAEVGDQARVVEEAAPVRPRRPGPKGRRPEHYADVARRYQRAVERHRKAPVAALADELDVSPATAHRWLNRCREMGLLDPIERQTRPVTAGNKEKGKRR